MDTKDVSVDRDGLAMMNYFVDTHASMPFTEGHDPTWDIMSHFTKILVVKMRILCYI